MDIDKKNGIRFSAVTPAMWIFEQDSSTVTSCHTDSMWIRGEHHMNIQNMTVMLHHQRYWN
jgi:hypothetical protein